MMPNTKCPTGSYRVRRATCASCTMDVHRFRRVASRLLRRLGARRSTQTSLRARLRRAAHSSMDWYWQACQNLFRLVSYDYGADGRLSGVTCPKGVHLLYEYDKFGQLSQLMVQVASVSYEYNDLGQLVRKTTSEGVEAHLSYDAFGRVARVSSEGPEGDLIDTEPSFPSMQADGRSRGRFAGQTCRTPEVTFPIRMMPWEGSPASRRTERRLVPTNMACLTTGCKSRGARMSRATPMTLQIG